MIVMDLLEKFMLKYVVYTKNHVHCINQAMILKATGLWIKKIIKID